MSRACSLLASSRFLVLTAALAGAAPPAAAQAAGGASPIDAHPAAAAQAAAQAAPAAAAQASQADDTPLPDAATLLDAADAKVADAARRASLESLVAKGTFGMPGMGNGAIEEIWAGQRARFSVEFPGFGSMTQGTDGAMCWSTDPAMGVMVARGDEQGPVQRQFAITGRRATWRQLYARAETVARVELEGRAHVELRLHPARGEAESWFVDAESGLVSRVDLALPDFMGGTIPCQFRFSDWKDVDGLLFPHTKVQQAGMYTITFTYTDVVVNGAVTDEQLAPSADVLAAAAKGGTTTPRPPEDPTLCALEDVPLRPTVAIRTTVEHDQVGATLAVLLPELMAHVSQAGVSPDGPPFSRFHSIEGTRVDLEAGFPVRTAIEGAGRVVSSTLPAGKVAVTWHVGPFDHLTASYDRLREWIAAQQLTARGGFWEVYWTDPGLEPDPAKWRTQLLWPVE